MNNLKDMDAFIQDWVLQLKHPKLDHIAVTILSTCKTLHAYLHSQVKQGLYWKESGTKDGNKRDSALFLKVPKDISESRSPSLARSAKYTKHYQRMSKCTAAHSLNQEPPLTSPMGDKIQKDNLTNNNFPSLQFPFTTYNTARKKTPQKPNRNPHLSITCIWT